MKKLFILILFLTGALFAQYDYNPVLEDTTEIFTPWFLMLIDTTVSPPETTFVKAPIIKVRYIKADSISVPGGGDGSEQYGAGAHATSNYSTVIGNGAYTGTGHSGVIFGYGAHGGTGNYPTIFGREAYTGAGYGGLAIGYGAHTGNANASTAIGMYSVSTGTGSYAMGYGSTASANSAFAMGQSSSAIYAYSFALGTGATSGGNGSIAIGQNSNSGGVGGIAMGLSATAAANTFVLGGVNSTYGITNVYLGGYGITNATPAAYTIHGAGGLGTDIDGADIKIAGGKGTGNAAGGEIIFQTSDAGASGTTLQSLTTKMKLGVLGNVYLDMVTTLDSNYIRVKSDLFTDYHLSEDVSGYNTFLGVGVCGAGNIDWTGGNEGLYNTFIGYQAGYNITTGYENLFIGDKSGRSNTTGNHNVIVGSNNPGYSNTTGKYNTFLGCQVGYTNTAGEHNTFLGNVAGYYNEDGDSNTFVGSYAGVSNTTGFSNTYIGNQAGGNGTTGSDNIVIGNSKDLPTATTSDYLNIGDIIYGSMASGGVITIDPDGTGGILLEDSTHCGGELVVEDKATFQSTIVHERNSLNTASDATITLPEGDIISLGGSTHSITSITASYDGRIVVLYLADGAPLTLTFTDGSNLKLAGNFAMSGGDVLTLFCDGSDWYEISRSDN